MKIYSLILLLVGLLLAGNPLQIESIYATSTATPGSQYSVYNLFDGKPETLWKTADGTGPEEGIMIYFKTPVLINGLRFSNMQRGSNNTYSYYVYVNGSKKTLKYNKEKVHSLFIKFYGHKRTTYSVNGKNSSYKLTNAQALKEVSIGDIQFLKNGLPHTIELPTFVEASINASSTLKPHSAYSVHNLFDARKEFTWCEGVNGDGVGEKLNFTFQASQKITGLRIWNGYQRSQKHFKGNGRVKKATISDGTKKETVILQDKYGVQEVRFKAPFNATALTMTIDEIYKGTKYTDLCISELSFLHDTRIITVDNSSYIEKKRLNNEKEYTGTLLGSVLNKLISKRHMAEGEDDFDESVSLILRSDNTFVYYSDYGDVSSGKEKNIVADGNWSFVSFNGVNQTIKLFGQWLNVSEISSVYTGSSKSSYQRIFQDKITLSKKTFVSKTSNGSYVDKAKAGTGNMPYSKEIISLSGGKFLTTLYHEYQ